LIVMWRKPQSVSFEWLAFIRHNMNLPINPVGFWHWFTRGFPVDSDTCRLPSAKLNFGMAMFLTCAATRARKTAESGA
jgi:hypothetical protein